MPRAHTITWFVKVCGKIAEAGLACRRRSSAAKRRDRESDRRQSVRPTIGGHASCVQAPARAPRCRRTGMTGARRTRRAGAAQNRQIRSTCPIPSSTRSDPVSACRLSEFCRTSRWRRRSPRSRCVSRMRHGGHVKPACVPSRWSRKARRHRHPRRAEILLQLRRRRHVLCQQGFGRRRRLGEIHRAPHHRRELVIAAEHIACIARERRAAGSRRARRRADQNQRLVSVRVGKRRGQNGRTAKAVALEADIVLVDEGKSAQVLRPSGPPHLFAKAGGAL